MKKLIFGLIVIVPTIVFGQQFPLMEGYNINPFILSPSYAGIHNNKTVFVDYRSDWTGLDGGPRTYQISYSDRLNDKVGLGGKFIYDKTDIFKQTLLLGTYTYEVKIARQHLVSFGLSMGFFRNSIDLTKYYNNPDYVQDLALFYGQINSKMKFATDASALYRYQKVEAGILFSNLMFGTVRYKNADTKYKPLKNYMIHAAYSYNISDKWLLKPAVIFRGGQDIPAQFELVPSLTWNDRFWTTALYRSGGIFGIGLGGEVIDGLILNYSYNMSSNVALNTFGSHQLTLGVRINKLQKEKKVSG